MYLYGSDLWNNAAKNEALANYYWAPLSFEADGSILPMQCQKAATFKLAKGAAGRQLDSSAGVEGFTSSCDISGPIQHSQAFVATRSGILTKLTYTTFKSGHPVAGLQISICTADGKILSDTLIAADSIGWAPKNIVVQPDISVIAGTSYKILLKSASTKGCYGLEYNHKGSGEAYSSDRGVTFSPEENRTLKHKVFIQ
jgi:hypothetical protein